ncbi:hypothetical protein E8D34_10620 [Nocardioides sp. GY 10113]|uniref:hypothetical protein n=1 Tax=Nocardioides sp. GY 10113 TaxID=2569761 RepID=UPI0010A7C083|nr:hypothetical protein [Nocardioides sp. GY 10113]TIC86698.1 hypothetical protein E8D34_10620 [Nocardioides sp. GY 10113]
MHNPFARGVAAVAVLVSASLVTAGLSSASPAQATPNAVVDTGVRTSAATPVPGLASTSASDASAPPAVRLSDQNAAQVVVLSEDELSVPNEPPFSDLQVGQALVAPRDAEDVVIRRIDAIHPTDNAITLHGPSLSIWEVAQNVDADLSWDNSDLVVPSSPRASARAARAGINVSKANQWTLTAQWGSGANYIRGALTLTNDFSLGFNVDGGVLPPRVDATATVANTVTAKVALTAAAAGSWSGEKTFDNARVKMTCAVLPYGLGQVCPTLTPSIYGEFNASVKGGAQATFRQTTAAELTYSKGKYAFNTDETTKPALVSRTWGIKGNIDAKVTALVNVDFHYLSYDGPSLGVDVGPYVRAYASTGTAARTGDSWG